MGPNKGMQVNGFVGERLQLAREFRGITQTQLGGKVVASPALVSLLERNKKVQEPPEDLVRAFSEVLDFQVAFFYEAIADPFKEEECNFRHRRTAPEKIKSRVRAHATLLGEVVSRLSTQFSFPAYNVPVMPAPSLASVEQCAEECRQHWKIGLDSPIVHVGRVLENAGVPIITGIVDAKKIDAFSRKGKTTLVFLNKYVQSSSRWTFDLSHECGHLVMHSGLQTGSKETEAEADRFASAFLLPERAFRREFGTAKRLSWPHLFELKRRWRVSLGAIVRRAYDLGLIGALTYRQSYQYMTFKGWTHGEPQEPTFQDPELFVPALMGLGHRVKMTLHDLCNDLHFSKKTFAEVTGVAVPDQPDDSRGVLKFPTKSH
jgi:Zn-dependent peptidase ImmA (M78 family)/transcriptional regulator with XRE-family HTH domain